MMVEQASRIPAEWSPQAAIWVGWPRLRHEWGSQFENARTEIANFISHVSARMPVRVAVGDEGAEQAAHDFGVSGALLRRVPTGDIWLRDTGPVFGLGKNNALQAHCFAFNGWGEKFIMPGDTETNSAIAANEGALAMDHDFVLEGGAVDHDGCGLVLTTRECLLGTNRNGWSETQAERALERAIGARRIIWLDRGLLNDHTDGHVDNIARFIGPGRVLCQRATSKDDPHAERLLEIEDALRAAGLDCETVCSPGGIWDDDGAVLPASHMNFIFANREIVVPVFDVEAGETVAKQLRRLLPQWSVKPLPSRAILSGGGSFHCMTCNVPSKTESRP